MTLILDRKTKPAPWDFDRDKTAHEWGWFHDAAIAIFPLWEGGGPTVELLSGQQIALKNTSTGDWMDGQFGEAATYAGADPDADWVFENTGIYLPNFDGDGEFTILAQFKTHASFQANGSVFGLYDTADTIPRIRVVSISGFTQFNMYDGGASAPSTTNGSNRWYGPGGLFRCSAIRSIDGANQTMTLTTYKTESWNKEVDSTGPQTALSFTQPSGGWRVLLGRGLETLDYVYLLRGALTEAQQMRVFVDPFGPIRMDIHKIMQAFNVSAAAAGRIMSSLAGHGGLAGAGGIAGPHGGLAG